MYNLLNHNSNTLFNVLYSLLVELNVILNEQKDQCKVKLSRTV